MKITVLDKSDKTVFYSFKLDTNNIISNYGFAYWNPNN